MSREYSMFVLSVVFALLLTGAVSAFLVTRASRVPSAPNTHPALQLPNAKGPRNLSLRPEALGVSRRLGKRFDPSSRAVSSSSGYLTISGTQHPIGVVRRQTQDGETVQVTIGAQSLIWSESEGLTASSGLVSDPERLLVDRLVFDSPDQFVLAQLRGASYFTIARNVRPSDAADGYSGSLWNLVRVNEPQREENLRPLIPWRIYYINVQTGLPNGVESQLNGQQIRAEFLEWIEQNGEKTPSHIRWSSNDQPVMEYRITSVSHNQ